MNMGIFDPEEIERIIRTAKERIEGRPGDPVEFAHKYLPVRPDPDRPKLGPKLPRNIQRWMRFLWRNKEAMIIGPPGHGKTWAIENLIIYSIALDREISALYASKTSTKAEEVVSRIRDELNYNRRLIRDYGEFYNREAWGAKRFKVRRRTRSRNPTLQAVGLGGQIEGARLKLAVLDDIVDIGSLLSQAERERAEKWLMNTLLPRMDPGARLWVIGSRWHFRDIYAIIKTLPGVKVLEEKALTPHVTKSGREVERPLAPEMWSYLQLVELRERLGTHTFNLRYQGIAAERETAPFPEARIMSYSEVLARGPWKRFVALDLNVSEKDKSDLTALVSVTLLKDYTLVVDSVHSAHIARGYREWVNRHINQTVRNLPRVEKLYVESVGFQTLAAREIEQKGGLFPVPVIRITPPKISKYERIVTGLQGWLEAGKLVLLEGGPGINDLAYDIMAYPDVPWDDRLDALEMVVTRVVREIQKRSARRVIR